MDSSPTTSPTSPTTSAVHRVLMPSRATTSPVKTVSGSALTSLSSSSTSGSALSNPMGTIANLQNLLNEARHEKRQIELHLQGMLDHTKQQLYDMQAHYNTQWQARNALEGRFRILTKAHNDLREKYKEVKRIADQHTLGCSLFQISLREEDDAEKVDDNSRSVDSKSKSENP